MSSPKNCVSENQVKCHEKPYSLLRKIAMNPKESSTRPKFVEKQ